MNLKLENIGIIQKADIDIDGLTVIAGENDSGKSTIGKVLYSLVKSFSKDKKVGTINIQNNFSKYFESDISDNGKIVFIENDKNFEMQIIKNEINFDKSNTDTCFLVVDYISTNAIMIETPLIWNLMDIFSQLPLIEDAMDVSLKYPRIMKDLHFNLSIKSKKDGIDISNIIKEIIGGEFLKSQDNGFYFNKEEKKIKLINTATGIKYFGILQTLSNNNHLYENQILILDEPEVHLHPKWQLKLANIIVSLVKSGVKVIVNSHSPYMIEALQRYSEKENLNEKTNFYMAEDGIIGKKENSNSQTLSEIFEKLSEPFDEFDKLDTEILHG